MTLNPLTRLTAACAAAALIATVAVIPASAEGPSPSPLPPGTNPGLPVPVPAVNPAPPTPPGSASSSAAPTVTTGGIGIGAQNRIVFMGTINAQNAPTSWWFEYGTTTSYTSTAPACCGSAAVTLTGATQTSVQAAPVALPAGTLYHYRLVARNSVGTTNGADATMSTPAAPEASPPVKRGTGRSCAHPFKLVVHHNGDSSTGDRKHIRAIVSNIGIEWLPIAPKVVICEVRGIDTNGKHWRVTGHPHGTHHSFAHGALLQTATITARVKG
jgi:hypothetical protein